MRGASFQGAGSVDQQHCSWEKEVTKTGKTIRILLVAGDTPSTAAMIQLAVTRLDADITLVDTVQDARSLTAADRFDLIIAEQRLRDGRGLELLEADNAGEMPFVLLDETLDAERVLAAMRLGAVDVLQVPFEPQQMVRAVRRAVRIGRLCQYEATRSRRLRRLSSRLIRDRRELRKRVDLICRDLVVAYRRLAEKVASTPELSLSSDPQWAAEDSEGGLAAG